MGRSNKSENSTPQFDEGEFLTNMAGVLDQVPIMMALPKAIREQWLKEGFSETAAEQAALAVWISAMTGEK